MLYQNYLVLFRCVRWTDIINITPYKSFVGDICIFKGRIYAVQLRGGITVAVGPEDSSVKFVADIPGWLVETETKLLVESEGELLLLLVEWFESATEDDALRIDVFRLDEKYKKWVKLTSLGNRILFLGNGSSFSASASDLSVAKGNCVIFMDDDCIVNKICNNASGMCLFDLDQGRVLPLTDFPDYLNLFWPPPEWIVISAKKQ